MGSSVPFLFVVIRLISSGSNDNYCPSPHWTPCAPAGHTCLISGTVNQTTISFGGFNPSQQYNTLGQWDFTEVTNTRGDVLQIPCSPSEFGHIYPNRNADSGAPPLGCCYTSNDGESFINLMGPSTNEENWKKLANSGEKFIANPTEYVRYGAVDELGAVYIYRWMQGEFVCQPSLFGAIQFWKNAKISCSTITMGNISSTEFIQCGDSKINHCNLDVVGTSSKDESILLVQYGSYPNYLYRYAYSTNNQDQIPCNNAAFGTPNKNGVQFCAASNNTIFTGAVGLWTDVESCAGSDCIIDTDVMYGTTSTNTKSTTTTWQRSVSRTVSTGFAFEGFSFSYSLTTTTSESVSHTVQNSYTQSASKTCGVQCGNGSAADWTVYQWQFKMAEYIGTDLEPFEIYACYYVCSTSNTAPQCPPGYCLPGTDCTQCQGWSPPNSTLSHSIA